MAIPVVELDGVEGLPAMPTLSGLLLGYPAVYVVHDLPSAQAASRCLSATSLCFYSAALLGQRVRAGGTGVERGPGGTRMSREDEDPLLALSVPQELAGDPRWEARRSAWLAALRARVEAAALWGFPWHGVALHVQQNMPRPIAL